MGAEEGDRLFDSLETEQGAVLFDDSRFLDGFDDGHGADVEQRRVARVGGDDDIVQIHAKPMGDNVFGHSEIVVRRAAAQDDVAFCCPDVACEYIDGELFGLVCPFDFPSCVRRSRLKMERGGIAFFVSCGACDIKRRGERRLTNVRRPVVGSHRHIDGNGVELALTCL